MGQYDLRQKVKSHCRRIEQSTEAFLRAAASNGRCQNPLLWKGIQVGLQPCKTEQFHYLHHHLYK